MTRAQDDGHRLGSRRDFVANAAGGLGTMALGWLLAQDRARADEVAGSPLAPRPPHFPPKAQRVIYLFMHGGPSHLETFDPKPDLQRLAGQPLPASFGPVATRRQGRGEPAAGARSGPSASTARAASRSPTSSPTSRGCADDLAVIRSCWADSVNHPQAVYQMNTGSILMGKPEPGELGRLRPGDREPGPAGVRRPARPRRRASRAARPPTGRASCRRAIRGRVMRGGDEPDPRPRARPRA